MWAQSGINGCILGAEVGANLTNNDSNYDNKWKGTQIQMEANYKLNRSKVKTNENNLENEGLLTRGLMEAD